MSEKNVFSKLAGAVGKSLADRKERKREDREANPSNCKKFVSSTIYPVGSDIHSGFGNAATGKILIAGKPKEMHFPCPVGRIYRYAIAWRGLNYHWTVKEFYRWNDASRGIPHIEELAKEVSYRDAVAAVMKYEGKTIWELKNKYRGNADAPLPTEEDLRSYFMTIIEPTTKDLKWRTSHRDAEDMIKHSSSRGFPHVLIVEQQNRKLRHG